MRLVSNPEAGILPPKLCENIPTVHTQTLRPSLRLMLDLSFPLTPPLPPVATKEKKPCEELHESLEHARARELAKAADTQKDSAGPLVFPLLEDNVNISTCSYWIYIILHIYRQSLTIKRYLSFSSPMPKGNRGKKWVKFIRY